VDDLSFHSRRPIRTILCGLSLGPRASSSCAGRPAWPGN
jgi:hypothetical protein